MKIIGITRIRNEENIIKNTLDHVGKLVDSIYIYDDCSTDKTIEICKKHPKVKKVIEGKEWKAGAFERNKAEGDLRQIVYEEALKENPDYIYYFDADEYADFKGINFTADAYRLRLFDFYITEEDKDKNYLERKYCGPEYRDILMLFKPQKNIRFFQREPSKVKGIIKNAGYVKHYGKAISIEEWEKTCDYYINERWNEPRFLKFKNKWENRKGKAIHTKSDFNHELITWDERKEKGFKLIDSL